MAVIATICARGGSTGVPRKNVRIIGGKPLIEHTIEHAKACSFIDHVFVSTDDDEIAEIARRAGATVPYKRPAHLATQHAAKLPVIEHLVETVEDSGIRVDKIVDLDPTSPLREPNDVEVAYQLLDDETDVVITGYEAEKNPYFNMVEIREDGITRLSKEPQKPIVARQLAPKVYSMNGSVYVWHRHTLALGLWNGRSRLHIMPHERSIDIDTEIDFKLASLILGQIKQ